MARKLLTTNCHNSIHRELILNYSSVADSAEVAAVELDRDLIPVLRTKFFRYEGKFTIHEADALKFAFFNTLSLSH